MRKTAILIGVVIFAAASCSKFEERAVEGEACSTSNDCKTKPVRLKCVNKVCVRPDAVDVPEPPPEGLDLPESIDLPGEAIEAEAPPETVEPDTQGDAPDQVEIDAVEIEVQDIEPAEDVSATEDGGEIPDAVEGAEDIGPDVQTSIGQPCTGDGDCLPGEGPCVDWAGDKKVCSGPCPPAGCPEGTFCKPVAESGAGYEYRCMPFSKGLCHPCQAPSDCPIPNSWCLDMKGGKFCGSPCPDGVCPDGFGCVVVDAPDVPAPAKAQCIPEVGTCECSQDLEGEILVCAVIAGENKCMGTMTCSATAGWGKCSAFLPGPEQCDDHDDDCDGQTDEDFTIVDWDGTFRKVGEACGTGACANGLVQCVSETQAKCSTDDLKGVKEDCGDGVDNDCNGKTEDGCYSGDLDGDGAENEKDCAPYDAARYPGADEPCCPLDTPKESEVATCDYNCDQQVAYCSPDDKDHDGHLPPLAGGDDCDDNDPNTYAGAFEKCNDGIDQDCSGEDLPCAMISDKDGDGYAKGKGGDCNDDDPGIHPLAEEQCDFIDNDCDGITDEGNPSGGQDCGPSEGECNPGSLVCAHYPPAGVKVECVGAKGPKDDVCDGLDNNCDGATDEGFPDKGSPCDGNDSDLCQNGTWTCKSDGTGLECVNEKLKDITEKCNNKDDDCDGVTDNGCWPEDLDGDGFLPPQDCDDTRAEVNPSAKESCAPPNLPPADQLKYDWNCDGQATPCSPDDKDFDGHIAKAAGGDDCNDSDATVYPGAPEKCADEVDQDCNGTDMACSADKDGDGFLPPAKAGDCNDSNQDVHPYAEEKCDYVDNDCDGLTDEGNPEAQPGDCGSSVGQCKPGKWVCVHYAYEAKVECVVEQGPTEDICDGKDNNCNGLTDEYFPEVGKPCDGPDSDQCKNGTWKCKEDGSGVECGAELVENIVELCDGIDNDCDGATDEDFAYEGHKFGEPCKGKGECGIGVVECGKMMKSATCSTNPNGSASEAKPEVCDGKDNDCDGVTDNGLFYNGVAIGEVCLGIGACGGGIVECSAITGKPTCSSNPDGSFPAMKLEKCNGLDDNCDGHTDEGVVAKPGDCNDKGVCAGFAIPGKCKKGKWFCDYSAVPGYEGPGEKSCDGKDNNCDGQVDEPFTIGQPCDGPDTDFCKNGTWSCKPDFTGNECINETVENLEEWCNGKDDNCDGFTDEGFTVGEPCDTEDSDECKNGEYTCTADGSAVACLDETVKDIKEICNGVDDDCDGQTDEGFKVGEACDGPDPDLCATGHFVCSLDGNSVDCADDVGGQTSEVCDGMDNDCDGATDEDFTYTGLKIDDPCDGVGACGEGSVKCRVDQGGATCSTNPDGPDSQVQPEVCDGQDNDCDGTTDEDMTWEGKALGESCDLPGECGPGLVACSVKAPIAICSTMDKIEPEKCDGKDNDCNGQTDDLTVGDKSGCKVAGICLPELVDAICIDGKWQCDYNKVPGYIDSPETICNGIDENCDGDTDDQFPTGEPCDGPDTDSCKNGTFTCTGDGAGVECVNEKATDIKEVCGDGVDNDCNGLTDEENGTGCIKFYLDTDQDNHGKIGEKKCLCKKADVPFYTAPVGDDCDDNNKDVYPGLKEVCNGIDDNCNGKTDEIFTDLGKSCDGPDEDVCKNGTYLCTPDGKGVSCEGDYNLPELCNGKDDDCDGSTDEDFTDLGKVCDGDDTDICKYGTFTCKPDGSGVTCVNENPANIAELCNAKDDDCDGLTDEDFKIGQACDGPDADDCKNGKWQCKLDGSGAECGKETVENIVELCDNIDNDCDGKTDEEWPDKGKKCDIQDSCSTGVTVCKPDKSGVQCNNDFECVQNAICQSSGSATLPDECLCGEGVCNKNIATYCTPAPNSNCVCGAGPYCTGGKKCVGGKCQ